MIFLKRLSLFITLLISGCYELKDEKIYLSCEGIERTQTVDYSKEAGQRISSKEIERKMTLKIHSESRESFFKRKSEEDPLKNIENKKPQIYVIKFTDGAEFFTRNFDNTTNTSRENGYIIAEVTDQKAYITQNSHSYFQKEGNKSLLEDIYYSFDLDRISSVFSEKKKIEYGLVTTEIESKGICKKIEKII